MSVPIKGHEETSIQNPSRPAVAAVDPSGSNSAGTALTSWNRKSTGWNTWLNNKMRIAVFALSSAIFWTTFGVGLSTNKYQEANFVKGRQQPWRSQCVPNSPGTQTKKKPNKRHKNSVRASGPRQAIAERFVLKGLVEWVRKDRSGGLQFGSGRWRAQPPCA